jgi:hypothetical protein
MKLEWSFGYKDIEFSLNSHAWFDFKEIDDGKSGYLYVCRVCGTTAIIHHDDETFSPFHVIYKGPGRTSYNNDYSLSCDERILADIL